MKQIILFDGVCNLCNASVNFIIDHDSQKKFRFASLQSDFAQDLIHNSQTPNQFYTSKGLLPLNEDLKKKANLTRFNNLFRGRYILSKIRSSPSHSKASRWNL